jgi:hypothetical protein
MPGNMACTPYCTVQTPPQALISLFATPDKGYRFKNWAGACVKTVGPLCTLKSQENSRVTAHFIKTKAPQSPAKALLLLHDADAKHTVWNDFVKQRFNNQCPVIYGGVLLEKEPMVSANKVYCYRVSFGYYDRLKQSENLKLAKQTISDSTPKKNSHRTHFAYEVQAAVLGILERHPNLSLTLIGQGQGALAARTFLQSDTDLTTHVVGLLALQPAHSTGTGNGYPATLPPLLTLEAEPDQDAKISAALTQLTQSWWMDR